MTGTYQFSSLFVCLALNVAKIVISRQICEIPEDERTQQTRIILDESTFKVTFVIPRSKIGEQVFKAMLSNTSLLSNEIVVASFRYDDITDLASHRLSMEKLEK